MSAKAQLYFYMTARGRTLIVVLSDSTSTTDLKRHDDEICLVTMGGENASLDTTNSFSALVWTVRPDSALRHEGVRVLPARSTYLSRENREI